MYIYDACFIVAILLCLSYRHMKIRYQLLTYDRHLEDSYFYGSDEMTEAFSQALNKNNY